MAWPIIEVHARSRLVYKFAESAFFLFELCFYNYCGARATPVFVMRKLLLQFCDLIYTHVGDIIDESYPFDLAKNVNYLYVLYFTTVGINKTRFISVVLCTRENVYINPGFESLNSRKNELDVSRNNCDEVSILIYLL